MSHNHSTPAPAAQAARKRWAHWACTECGKTFSSKGVEKAMLSTYGCPSCGSADFEILPIPTHRARVSLAVARG